MLFALDVFNVNIVHPYTTPRFKNKAMNKAKERIKKNHSFLHNLTARLNTYQSALNKVLLLEREHFWHFIRMISLHPYLTLMKDLHKSFSEKDRSSRFYFSS